jgi:hypothetical protein
MMPPIARTGGVVVVRWRRSRRSGLRAIATLRAGSAQEAVDRTKWRNKPKRSLGSADLAKRRNELIWLFSMISIPSTIRDRNRRRGLRDKSQPVRGYQARGIHPPSTQAAGQILQNELICDFPMKSTPTPPPRPLRSTALTPPSRPPWRARSPPPSPAFRCGGRRIPTKHRPARWRPPASRRRCRLRRRP